jgi:hypothetical protein
MSKYQTFMCVGDNHGDKGDQVAFDGMREFIKDFRPKHRIHLGDCFDFRSIRRGVSTSDNESHESLREDVECGMEFISAMKPTAFLYGNHEDRLHQMMFGSNNGVVRDYAYDLDQVIRKHLRKTDARLFCLITLIRVFIGLDLSQQSTDTLVALEPFRNTPCTTELPAVQSLWGISTASSNLTPESTEELSDSLEDVCAQEIWITQRTDSLRLCGVLDGRMESLRGMNGRCGRLTALMTDGFGQPK